MSEGSGWKKGKAGHGCIPSNKGCSINRLVFPKNPKRKDNMAGKV